MKKLAGIIVVAAIMLSACGPKPYYKTTEGRKKQRYYNSIQFGQEHTPPKRNLNK
jgi:hypothetical protein